MYNNLIKILCLFIFLLNPAKSYALEDYICTIVDAFQVDEKGKRIDHILQSSIGNSFTVNRKTGIMSGSLHNSYSNIPTVIDEGSASNSFKVFNSMNTQFTSNTYSLTIEEFTTGVNKPFVFLRNADIYYGICKYF
jgi:hypothetical protein